MAGRRLPLQSSGLARPVLGCAGALAGLGLLSAAVATPSPWPLPGLALLGILVWRELHAPFVWQALIVDAELLWCIDADGRAVAMRLLRQAGVTPWVITLELRGADDGRRLTLVLWRDQLTRDDFRFLLRRARADRLPRWRAQSGRLVRP